MKALSRVRLLSTPWTVAYQAPLSMGFSRQEYWSGVPLPSPRTKWYHYPNGGNSFHISATFLSVLRYLRLLFPQIVKKKIPYTGTKCSKKKMHLEPVLILWKVLSLWILQVWIHTTALWLPSNVSLVSKLFHPSTPRVSSSAKWVFSLHFAKLLQALRYLYKIPGML